MFDYGAFLFLLKSLEVHIIEGQFSFYLILTVFFNTIKKIQMFIINYNYKYN